MTNEELKLRYDDILSILRELTILLTDPRFLNDPNVVARKTLDKKLKLLLIINKEIEKELSKNSKEKLNE